MDPLSIVAEAAHVREGAEAVRRVVVSVYRGEGHRMSTRNAARRSRLPVPVTSAVLRELEKLGLVTRGTGTTLSEAGLRYAEGALGLAGTMDVGCDRCGGKNVVIGPEFADDLKALEQIGRRRPVVDWTLDQSHATAATSLRRALLLHRHGDLTGRSIAFLGDDDLTSIAAALVLARIGAPPDSGALTVLEYDRRLVDYIAAEAAKHRRQLEVERLDLMWPLPAPLGGMHDIALCDPPYALPGLRLIRIPRR